MFHSCVKPPEGMSGCPQKDSLKCVSYCTYDTDLFFHYKLLVANSFLSI